MSVWNFFGKAHKEAEPEEDDNALASGSVPVDMTTLDISYITHRLVGE